MTGSPRDREVADKAGRQDKKGKQRWRRPGTGEGGQDDKKGHVGEEEGQKASKHTTSLLLSLQRENVLSLLSVSLQTIGSRG